MTPPPLAAIWRALAVPVENQVFIPVTIGAMNLSRGMSMSFWPWVSSIATALNITFTGPALATIAWRWASTAS